jgi:aldehyde dehydrogenase (NAD+)
MMQEVGQVAAGSRSRAFSGLFSASRSRSLQLRSEPVSARLTRLKKLRDWVLNNRSRIKGAMYNDFRKPPMEVETSEIFTVVSEVNHAIRNLSSWAKPRLIDAPITYLGTRSTVRYEPKGVCLIIAPWNYPFNLSVGPLISCLAAGNTAILKPSELTPHTSSLVASMAEELFDSSEVTVVEGDASVTQDLLKMPFDHIFFTGSPAVGKIVMKAAAENLSSVTLELGGKSPAIIDSTANLRDAARRIAFGKFINCGQTCIAPDYLLIERGVREEFLKLLSDRINDLFGAGASVTETSAEYGRIVNARHYSRLSRLINDAIEHGARPAIGGTVNESKLFIQPTVLVDVSPDAMMMEEEIFGPVLPIIEVDSAQSAIDIINMKPKPLALYLFSNNRLARAKVLQETSSGAVCINDCVIQFAQPELPFGGVNNSGMGKSHGQAGFMAFSNEKPVIYQKRGLSNAYLFHPPFNGVKRKLLEWVTRVLS